MTTKIDNNDEAVNSDELNEGPKSKSRSLPLPLSFSFSLSLSLSLSLFLFLSLSLSPSSTLFLSKHSLIGSFYLAVNANIAL